MYQLELDLVGGENPTADVAATGLLKKNDTKASSEDGNDSPEIPIQLELDLSLP